jgi:hypothetical protein
MDLNDLQTGANADTDPTRPRSGSTPSTRSSPPPAGPSAQVLVGNKLLAPPRAAIGLPSMVSTPYINTIAPEQEPWFPVDDEMERRIRA